MLKEVRGCLSSSPRARASRPPTPLLGASNALHAACSCHCPMLSSPAPLSPSPPPPPHVPSLLPQAHSPSHMPRSSPHKACNVALPLRMRHVLPETVPAEVGALVCDRCERFNARPYDVDAVAVTHVPKMGGTSIQDYFVEQAHKAGKRTFNAHKDIVKHPNVTMNELRAQANSADILYGHATAAWEEDALGWRGGAFSLVTVLRDPLDTLQSLFRFNGGQPEQTYQEHLRSQSHAAAGVRRMAVELV